jgi:hypothetical protein
VQQDYQLKVALMMKRRGRFSMDLQEGVTEDTMNIDVDLNRSRLTLNVETAADVVNVTS